MTNTNSKNDRLYWELYAYIEEIGSNPSHMGYNEYRMKIQGFYCHSDESNPVDALNSWMYWTWEAAIRAWGYP